ncbi:hypothetical protein M3J09_006348 [Ascochyta lentis]
MLTSLACRHTRKTAAVCCLVVVFSPHCSKNLCAAMAYNSHCHCSYQSYTIAVYTRLNVV